MDTHDNHSGQERHPDEFGFEWQDPDGELTPEHEALLRELSVPIGRVPVRRLAEIVRNDLVEETRDRLEALRVEGYDHINESWIKAAPELQMTPYILDDVHYEVYRRTKNRGPYNRFVSVSAEEIFDEFDDMKQTGVNGIILQRQQDDQAKRVLIKNHIEENSVYEAMNTPLGRFAVRSMCRLLREDSMVPFTRLMLKATRRRMDEAPLSFAEIATHAPNFIEIKLNQHEKLDVSQLSTDQRLMHELIVRDLRRTKAFAIPIIEYMSLQADIEARNEPK